MKIVILDGHPLNPGDLSWEAVAALGELAVFPRTAAAEVVARCSGAAIVLTNKVVLSRAIMEALPELRYIGVLATGTNVVDLAAARERGVVVTNIPGYSTSSVAQMVFALLLEMTNQVGHHAALVREGAWSACADFSFTDRPLVELEGRTLGVVGYGTIGQVVAARSAAFGMTALVATRNPERYRGGLPPHVRLADLETVFALSDVVTLHCPQTPETLGLVSRERLARMKAGAYLINTGRGTLVDEEALAEALNSGKLAGAGLDVLSSEPPAADNPLLTAKNCFVTPHIAWATREARQRLLEIAVGNIRNFQGGSPRNVVS